MQECEPRARLLEFRTPRDCRHAKENAMVTVTSPSATAAPPILPVLAGLLAVGIFAADTISDLDISIAVLYITVVLLSLNFLEWRGVLVVSVGCVALTV